MHINRIGVGIIIYNGCLSGGFAFSVTFELEAMGLKTKYVRLGENEYVSVVSFLFIYTVSNVKRGVKLESYIVILPPLSSTELY